MIDLHFHPAFIVNDSIVELPTKCLFYRVEGRQTPYDGVPSMINRSLNHISHDWSLNMRWTPALWNFFVQFNKKYDQKSFPDLTAIRIAGTCNPNPAVHSSSAPLSKRIKRINFMAKPQLCLWCNDKNSLKLGCIERWPPTKCSLAFISIQIIISSGEWKKKVPFRPI